jgi:hypothetical protein
VNAGPLTVRQLGESLTGRPVTDDLLSWAPDVAALTTVLLERSHAFRFVVSPPENGSWPPQFEEYDDPFAVVVSRAATRWCAAMGGPDFERPPELVLSLWTRFVEHLDTPLSEMAAGRPWALCEAVLALHAIADEASAGCTGAHPRSAPGAVHVARAREMLTRTGSMARFPADRVAHTPKTRTTGVGITHRSLSRYTSTTSGGIPTVWHRAPLQRAGTDPSARRANVLLLPWPLRIRESDFVPVPGSVRRPEREPFGFFNYVPSEPLDLGLVDRLLEAARDEVDAVDVVVMPEAALAATEVPAMETVLAKHRVSVLITGIREEPPAPGRFPGNAVHVGVLIGDEWSHHRQNKHHRWFLDAGQIEQYNIAGALHPTVRWWEAMDVPQRSVHILELGAGVTLAAVVCEDLARLDGVAEHLRSVGPSMVITHLLDGPQLASRWTARYASVLADDPGSSVLTITAYGMVRRSRPRGLPPSNVIALWKDPVRGLREIPMEDGAQGVILKTVLGRSARYAADGRAPADDATDLYVAGVHQVRADPSPRTSTPPATAPDGEFPAPALDAVDLGVLASWAEAVARAAAAGGPVDAVLAEAEAGAPWRARVGVDEPSEALASGMQVLAELTRKVRGSGGPATPQAMLTALRGEPGGPDPMRRLVRRTLAGALDAALRV